MTEPILDKLLGSADRDPGCDAGIDFIDEYCELVLRGEAVPDRFADFRTHIANCIACREDTEGLLAVLRDQEKSSEG
jgi:hypothetical protein